MPYQRHQRVSLGGKRTGPQCNYAPKNLKLVKDSRMVFEHPVDKNWVVAEVAQCTTTDKYYLFQIWDDGSVNGGCCNLKEVEKKNGKWTVGAKYLLKSNGYK
tara:strand:+ start:526 stop:831 length:306 start_codon:yes stop_codon:yes gene_type:complete